ncbi:MAG: M16 family metallopeptidase [Chitinispirillaceae bacterium]
MLENIRQKTLKNGLKVICLKKNDAPIVSLQVWYKVGSVCEPDGVRGISHFLEHMMFRGSKNVASEEHARKINDVGGHCNAFTAEDVTAYVNSVPRDYLDLALELEADRMDGLSLDNSILETERKVVLEEYFTYMNNPVAKAFLEFRHEFYGKHPYALSPLGIIDDLRSFSRDDCHQYYSRWYTPDNAVLVVVGDFESEQDVFEKVDQYFGTKSRRSDKYRVEKPDLNGAHRMKRKVDFDVPIMIYGFPAPPSSHDDALALEILQIVLSGGETSRLHREMVRKRSVAVMVGGLNQFLKFSGMSMFFAAFTPDMSSKKIEKELERQIEHLKNDGITEQEFEKVKNATLTSRTFELYSSENVCQRIGYGELIEGDYRLWARRFEALKMLNREVLVETARKYWDKSNRHLLLLKPKKTKPLLFAAGLLRRVFGRF